MTRHQRLTLLGAILGSAVVTVDGSIVNVALPAIEQDLGGGFSAQQWVVNAYLLTLASLILIGGSLGDIYGERRVFELGLVAFGAFSRLERVIRPTEGLRISEAWHDESERRYAEACRAGWEGLIAKRADAPYARGRSRDWLKLKCVLDQEFVIGGYTDPAGSRTNFGALLVGYYEGDGLRYAGKVGTGYSAERLTELGARLRKLETAESPFADAWPFPRGTHWTRPELVAQIGFAEWTAAGRLRQPRFLGLRDDKPPAEVVREQAG